MQKPLEKWIIQYTWVSSCSIVLLLLLFFNILATPLLNSGDDAYFMYTLSGGYGEAPTNLLQYNNGWHPWLGWLVKSLFAWAPGINWYGIILLLFHFAGLSAILYVLLKKLKPTEAVLLVLLLFIFIESRLLLSRLHLPALQWWLPPAVRYYLSGGCKTSNGVWQHWLQYCC